MIGAQRTEQWGKLAELIDLFYWENKFEFAVASVL